MNLTEVESDGRKSYEPAPCDRSSSTTSASPDGNEIPSTDAAASSKSKASNPYGPPGRAFKARVNKLLMWHGVSDASIIATSSIGDLSTPLTSRHASVRSFSATTLTQRSTMRNKLMLLGLAAALGLAWAGVYYRVRIVIALVGVGVAIFTLVSGVKMILTRKADIPTSGGPSAHTEYHTGLSAQFWGVLFLLFRVETRGELHLDTTAKGCLG